MAKLLTDEERMTDSLNAQKYVAEHYNSFALEAATPAVKACVMQILNEEQDIQHELFSEMSARGWYQTETADDTKLQNAKNKFASFNG